MIVCIALVSCAKITEIVQGPGPERVGHSPIAVTPANFDVAMKENQAGLAAGKIPPDVALYNSGFILAHPSNPKKDYPKAIVSFQTLVAEHPRSSLVDPARAWIQVLEQQQKITDARRKLAEEKRALDRERELLAQDRQKLNYASEKSRQLDLEIEKRRRQTLSK
jgi:TolA-binding protein